MQNGEDRVILPQFSLLDGYMYKEWKYEITLKDGHLVSFAVQIPMGVSTDDFMLILHKAEEENTEGMEVVHTRILAEPEGWVLVEYNASRPH